MSDPSEPLELTFSPVTPERWADFETLFGPKGACGGCWCMWWRLPRKEFDAGRGDGNRDAMRRLVESGEIPGLLAYHARKPIGWCSVGPRAGFPRLDRTKALARLDDLPVWSIVCFYVARRYRRRGVTKALVGAAVEYARARGAEVVEAYPVSPRNSATPDTAAYTGLPGSFAAAGFREVARRSETRPIVRLDLRERSGGRAL